jgi:hypothetical protein
MGKLRTLFLLSLLTLSKGQGLTIGDPTYSHCQDIAIPMCMEMPYKKTIYPNLMGHASQDEASHEIYQYFPLIKVNCSADIQVLKAVINNLQPFHVSCTCIRFSDDNKYFAIENSECKLLI